jgi:hypothetical protein
MRRLFLIAATALLVAAAGCGGSSSSSNGVVNVTVWHGYEDVEGKAMTSAAARFNATHPKIHVNVQYYGNSDYALQKVLTAIRGGSYPDISYLYGSWAANIARTPIAVDLSSKIKEPGVNWNDFWPAERQAVQVGDKVIGMPALVDNLALVYNKKLFDQAGIPYPTANWTWDDFRAAAQRLTDTSAKQFGWAYVADGSEDNWTFLRPYIDDECIDFYHATSYLYWVAKAVHPRSPAARQAWLDDSCHKLKHEKGYAKKLLKEMQSLSMAGLSESVQEELAKAITYFTNHHQQMKYAQRVHAKLPIGSGVTEAACKPIIKMRMCRGGAKWKDEGATAVLSLRTLIYTEGRWEQFWAKVDRYGFPIED